VYDLCWAMAGVNMGADEQPQAVGIHVVRIRDWAGVQARM